MKKHWTAMLISEAIGAKVFDEKAETTMEISARTGLSRVTVTHLIKEKCDAGIWERVWKQASPRPVPAYRIKRKK